MQEYGCEVSKRGKSYRLKLSGWEKVARKDSLGEGYGLEDLRAVLSGKKAHTLRKKTVTQAEPPKVNLLVDIQAKLQAGKGAGYARSETSRKKQEFAVWNHNMAESVLTSGAVSFFIKTYTILVSIAGPFSPLNTLSGIMALQERNEVNNYEHYKCGEKI